MAKICLVGEAFGDAEEKAQMPFVGPSGYLLNQMLEQAGVNRLDCHLTNVFNLKPRPTNDISCLCGPASEGIPGLPALRPGNYIRREYAPEIDRLREELRGGNFTLTIALGGTATWALLGSGAISKTRGTVAWSDFARCKVLPTFHPAAILREWNLRHVTVLDLMKAKFEAEFPEVRRPRREIWVDPTLEDLEKFYARFLLQWEDVSQSGRSLPDNVRSLAFDIETAGGQITCIGFAPTESVALVVPFVDERRADRSYWPTHREELLAWGFVRRVLQSPIPKVAQNGVYDVHWLWRLMGITVTNFKHDTMLLHHSLQPESQKGLGFLASVYSNESAWKLQFRQGRSGTIKKDS